MRICYDYTPFSASFQQKSEKGQGGLNLPLPLNEKYYGVRHQELISLIEKPKWIGKRSDGGAYTKEAKVTLIPDIITIAGDMFIIFDAKYYNIQMDEKKELRGQPGIESVTTQYLRPQKILCNRQSMTV